MADSTRRQYQVPGYLFWDKGAVYQSMEGIQTQEHLLNYSDIHMMAYKLGNNVDTGTEEKDINPNKFLRLEIADSVKNTEW